MQWGNAGSNNGSVDVTFPISFTKAVYQIQLTYNNSSYENPTYEIKDTKSFSYWSNYGGDKLWLAIGVQQWGLSDNIQRQTITFPISFPKICYHITWTATSSAGNPYKTSGYVNSVTNISFLARADDTACQKYWFAVGV